jgi:hypothetical protein
VNRHVTRRAGQHVSARQAVAVLAVTASLALTAGCTSSSSSKSTNPATTAPTTSATTANSTTVCADYDALKQSLSNLTHISVLTAGRDGINAALSDVTAKLTTLKSSARQEFEPQIDQLDSAVTQLKTTVSNLTSGNLAGSVTTIATQLTAIGTAGRNLGSAVSSTCPEATSS